MSDAADEFMEFKSKSCFFKALAAELSSGMCDCNAIYDDSYLLLSFEMVDIRFRVVDASIRVQYTIFGGHGRQHHEQGSVDKTAPQQSARARVLSSPGWSINCGDASFACADPDLMPRMKRFVALIVSNPQDVLTSRVSWPT